MCENLLQYLDRIFITQLCNWEISIFDKLTYDTNQRWSRGHKARGQGQGHKKKSEAKAKHSLSEDRPSRGQGQECSRPRTKDTAASVLQKKGFQKSFLGDLQFIGVPRNFDWGRPTPQIPWYDVIKNFQKRKFLWDKDIVGWKI